MRVAQVMKQTVETCRVDDTVHRAAQLMWEHDCGCIPVVDSDRRVIGMITDRDICMAAYTRGVPLDAIQVRDAMSNHVCVCRPQDALADAERTMRASQVHRLPVIDAGDRIVGILSLHDLAHAAARETGTKKGAITLAAVGETLAAICVPRRPHQVMSRESHSPQAVRGRSPTETTGERRRRKSA